MFRPKRASVESQVNLQPFLLAAAVNNADMASRHSADSMSNQRSTKRDSGFSDIVSAFPLSGNSRRTSWFRDNAADPAMALTTEERGASPVYRLYPHQSAGGSRRLRALRDSNTSSIHTAGQHSLETAIYTPVQDFNFDTHRSGPSSNVITSATITSPVDDFAETFTLPPTSTERPESRESFSTPLSSPIQAFAPAFPDTQVTEAIGPPGQPAPDVQTPVELESAPRQTPPLGSAFEETPRRGRSLFSTSYKRRSFGLPIRASSSLSLRRPPSTSTMGLHKVSSSGQIEDIEDAEPGTPETMLGSQHYGAGDRSSAESIYSQETTATSLGPLPPLQSKGQDDAHQLEPLIEDDPYNFDLVGPATEEEPSGVYVLEKRAELLMSAEHLQAIFDDPKLMLNFTNFLNIHRPKSIPLLIYYLDALKAVRAIKYANAIAEALDAIPGQEFTNILPQPTTNTALEQRVADTFKVLVQEDLPAYVSYLWIRVVSTSIQRRITGTLAPHLREASEGLAETFCLSDPSRKDNPIVFASEEFARTTQYGMTYAIGRNCRFLQGPRTSPHSVRRLAIACAAGKEHNEVFVNYRRDGSPFLNLLMTAPLMDSKGAVRYFIGAQVDVSGLLKGCNELPALAELVEKEENEAKARSVRTDTKEVDEFQELAEMFNGAELNAVRKHGGKMHKEYIDDDSDHESVSGRRPRVLLKDMAQDILEDDVDRSRATSISSAIKEKINGKLEGVYQHYLLVRPAPSLRILFTSPSLRVPGILQSPFLNRIGGSARVRQNLEDALADGRGVTAKVRWLFKADEFGEGDGRARWIHCTPLLGHSGTVGVWMIVLVEEEGFQAANTPGGRSKFRNAPPVSDVIGGKDWSMERSRDRSTRDKSRPRPSTSHTVDLEDVPRSTSTSRAQDHPPMPTHRPPIPDRVSVRTITGNPAPTSTLVPAPSKGPGPITSSGSRDGDSVSAPSPDIPMSRPGRTSIVDFERLKTAARQLGSASSVKGVGSGMGSTTSSRTPSYSAHHVMSQAVSGQTGVRSASVGRGRTTPQDPSFDLR